MSEEKKADIERGDTVVLTDVEDNEVELMCEDVLVYQGKTYGLFTPVEEMDDIEDDEVIILQYEQDKDGELVFSTIEDEKLIEEVYNEYAKMVDEYNEHCDCGCDDDECDCDECDEDCECDDDCDCKEHGEHNEHCDCHKNEKK